MMLGANRSVSDEAIVKTAKLANRHTLDERPLAHEMDVSIHRESGCRKHALFGDHVSAVQAKALTKV